MRLVAAALCAGALCGTSAQDAAEIEVVGEEDDASASFHRCTDPEETGSAIVDSFPRFAADMQRVPAGPGEYTWFRWDETCTDAPVICIAETSDGTGRYRQEGAEWGEPCEAGCYKLDVADAFGKETARTLPVDSAGRYVQGTVAFAGIFLVLAFIALTMGALCTGWTFLGCLCCCCKAKRGFPCCCLSAPRKKDEDGEYILDDGIPADVGSCYYKQKTKFCFRLFVIVPLSLNVFFLILGNARGNMQFVDSVNALVEAPRGFAAISNDAFELGDHVLELPLSILDEIAAINATVAAAVDFQACSDSLLCIEGMLGGLPDVGAITAELVNVQDGLQLLPSSTEMSGVLAALSTTLTDLQTTLTTVDTAITDTSTSLASLTAANTGGLDALKTSVSTAVTTLTDAQTAASGLQTAVTTFLGLRPDLSSTSQLQIDLATLAEATTAATFDETTPTAGLNDARERLKTELTDAKTGVENVKAGIPALETALNTFSAAAPLIDFTPVITAANSLDATLGAVPVNTIVTAVAQVSTLLQGFTVESSCVETDAADGSDDAAACAAVAPGVFAQTGVPERCAPTSVTEPPTECNTTFVPGTSGSCQAGAGCTYTALVAPIVASRTVCGDVQTSGGAPACTYNQGILEILDGLDQMINNHMPNVTLIQFELAKVNTTLQSISCMDPLIDAVTSVNDTLVRVPAATDEIMGMLGQTKGLTDSVGDITTSVGVQMEDFGTQTQTITDLDIPTFKTAAEGLQTSLNDDVNLTSITTQTEGMETALNNANGSAMTGPITDAQTELNGIDMSIPTEVNDALNATSDGSDDAAEGILTFHDAFDQCTLPLPSDPSTAGTCVAGSSSAMNLDYGDGGAVDNFIALLNRLETGYSDLDTGLDTLRTGIQPLVETTPPDVAAIDLQLDDAKAAIQSSESGISSASSTITTISDQLTAGGATFTSLDDQFALIAPVFDALGPMLDGAIAQVVGVASSLDALPTESVAMVGTFRVMIDQLITMRANLGQNITDAKVTIAGFREQIVTTREDFILWKMFYGVNSTFTMPDLEAGEGVSPGVFLNMTADCETYECFQKAVQYLDDNLLDVMSYVVATQMDMEPVITGISRTEAFTLLYLFTALGSASAIFGAVFLLAPFRALGSCVLWPTSFLFLLMGTILFPTMVIMSDTCGGLEHAAYNIVNKDTHLGLSVSELLIKNVTEVEAYLGMIPFNFSHSYEYPIKDIKLPGIPQIVESYFGTCPAPVAGVPSIDGTITEIGNFAENTTVGLINFAVSQVQELSGEIRPGLNQHVNNVKRLADNEVGEIFTSTGELVGCARVNEAYFEMKTAFCCEFVVMVYWMAASSVVVGCTGCWGICCIGCTTRSLRHMPSLPEAGEGDDSPDVGPSMPRKSTGDKFELDGRPPKQPNYGATKVGSGNYRP